MRIAFIRKKYTFHGGAEAYTHKIIEALLKQGHEVHLFAAGWNTSSASSSASSASSNPAGNIRFHKVPVVAFYSLLRDLTFAVFSYFIVKKHSNSIDIIQSHDKTLYQDIYMAHDGCHIEWLKKRMRHLSNLKKLSILINPYHWLILLLERIIFKGRRFRKVIAISEMVKKEIVENYDVNPESIEVIYYGIDTGKFHPSNRDRYRSEIRRQYEIDDGQRVVLFVGSGFERKGLAYLLQAVELCPTEITVLVVGKGNGVRYAKFAKRQRAIFCGAQSDTHKYYAAADIFVFPSIYEPFGLVHLEALASGLPVITMRSSGGHEIIREGVNGFVINSAEDVKSIAEKIELAFESGRYERLTKNARASAEPFTIESHMNRLFQVYDTLPKINGKG